MDKLTDMEVEAITESFENFLEVLTVDPKEIGPNAVIVLSQNLEEAFKDMEKIGKDPKLLAIHAKIQAKVSTLLTTIRIEYLHVATTLLRTSERLIEVTSHGENDNG